MFTHLDLFKKKRFNLLFHITILVFHVKLHMKIHFISIGGSVMHQLAIALKHKSYIITGSDDEIYEPSRSLLEAEGILPPSFGWNPANIKPDLDAVILGMHAREDNPELLKAKELGLPIYSFPEYIYQESKHKTRVAIGGSHGKTTTTSMVMHVLENNKQKIPAFDYLVGARLEGFAQSVQITDAPIIICEADEYPASAIEKRPKFHFLFPQIAVLTGIAWDHINVFPQFDNYLEQFRIFLEKLTPNAVLIYNETDPVLKTLVEDCPRTDLHLKPYGVPDYTIEAGITYLHMLGTRTAIEVFGAHNLMNLNAAWLVSEQLGLNAVDFLTAIATFKGASRRLEKIGAGNNCIVYRDFAHAPSKVIATTAAVKKQYPDQKLIVVFELHTYSSLSAAFLKEYAGALQAADEAAVFYSQQALAIKKLEDLKPEQVQVGFNRADLRVLTTNEALDEWLNSRDFPHSVLLFMSSGHFGDCNILNFAQQITAEPQ